MGLPVSLLLIAVGAVLAFAVNQTSGSSVDLDVVGWILMGVGFFGLVLSLWWWEQFGPGHWGWPRGAPADGPYPPHRRGYAGRRRVVEEEEGGPAGPPPGPPPP
jgi:hypothetical protein